MVLVSHSFALVGLAEPLVLHNTLGSLGVDVFFVTSGYLIFQSWQRDPSPVRYLIRRSLRIFPALFVILMMTAFVIGPTLSSRPLGNYFSDPATYQYLGNLYFVGSKGLHGVFESNPYPHTVNGGLWTLKYEFFMYLFLLGLGLLGKRTRLLLPFGLAFAVAGSATAAFLTTLPPEQFPTWLPWHDYLVKTRLELSGTALRFPELACYFLIGALCGYWRELIAYRWTVFAMLGIAWYLISSRSEAIFLVWALVAYGSLAFGNATVSPLTKFGKHGDFSYGIYIYGFVVQQCVSSLLGPTPSWAIALTLSFVVTAIFAFLSWNLIEAPALSGKDRLCALINSDASLISAKAL